MSIQIASKLPAAGTTIFSVMSRLAREHGAIDLSQGFPDFEPDEALLDRVAHHLRAGKNQYPPMIGVPELRRAIAAKIARVHDVAVDAETAITVTSGATEALFCAIHAVVRRGDEVVVLDPAYDSYAPAVELAGGRCVHVPLIAPDYCIDWDAFDAALGARTRLVVINSPHNPCGAVLATDDLDRLADAIARRDCLVLSDEVYEHIIFDGATHASVLAHPRLAARSFAVFSFGKTYHATGWKVGYCVAAPELTAEFRKVHQFNTFTTVAPMQYALADFIAAHPEQYENLPAFYQRKRDLFAELMAPSRFRLLPCRGTYFQLADYSELQSSALESNAAHDPSVGDGDGGGDLAFARWLTTEKGVSAIPLSPFHHTPPSTPIVRFCFAKQDDTLRKAAAVLSGV
ncbi:MAG: methionine aminotransferase [bacterium]